MIQSFKKKPVVIQAIQLLVTNRPECFEFVGKENGFLVDNDPDHIYIRTLEGTMTCRLGDWIIRGVNGEYYPCKPDIFEKTYDAEEVCGAEIPDSGEFFSCMTFGQALQVMKTGACVRRAGWNGKGMHIYIEDHFKCLVGKGGGLEHERKYGACIVMYTAQKTHQPGWLASQPDMLSSDWELVPYEELNQQ